MPTVRDMVSRVRSTNKLLSSDNLISDRAVASELKSKAIVLIRRETNLRRLWSTSTIFNEIPCLELEPVPLSSCCDYQSDRLIARTKHKLPAISEGIYGYLIQWVLGGDKRVKIKEVSLNRYLNLLDMNTKVKNVYYFIDNRYLYLTDPDIELAAISAYFEDDIPKYLMFPECKCNFKNPPYDECKNPLDLMFKCPGYLENNVVEMTSKYLVDTYFRRVPDETSNEKDEEK